ncbi:MAG: hypothetical protein IAA97_05380 [Spirochaetes bacterium]|uniref:Uncharacterized protein n=1 Tax=Candidatus Ornithospirochaeta stercoripullorum TaxID=2840899 RepID=A0A9D9E1Y4_9SPIO|nr:hypothetical protein [Candidatus Ornithospirochaeta stercoripullorum]
MEEIINIVRDGEEKTAIWIGSDDMGLPKHLMQGIKHDGIISDGKEIKPWIWDGLCAIDGQRYVYFAPCRLRSIYELSTSARKDALVIVRNIAFALKGMKKDFLDLITGIFPLYRIWIYNDTDVLIMPPDLGDVFTIMREEKRKEDEVNRIIQGTAEKQFLLITEMAELLYYAATGRFPFSSDAVRGSGYKEVPLSMYTNELPEKTEGLINFIFHAKSREMRDIMGNRDDGENLNWFLTRSLSLEWPLEDITAEERDSNIERAESSAEFKEFFEKRESITKRNAFWRVKGTLIIVISVVVIAVGGFLWSYISNILEPPATKDLDQKGIIEAFYQAQNNCDPEGISTAFKGSDPPQEMEIMNLYVASRTRMAYENFDPLISADEWVENGKPAVPAAHLIYGAVIDTIKQTGENTWSAEGTWYTPYPYNDGEEVTTSEGTMPVYTYDVTQSFTFEWNDRGWWNITDAPIESDEFLGVETVETYIPEL